MAPILPLLLSLMLIQEAAPAPEAQAEAPAPAAAPAEVEYPVPPGAPEDDYGLVAWCFGALDGHMRLYDKVLPEVTRIETEIARIPGAPPADMQAYKDQRTAGRDTLKLFRGSMEAAEKASAKPISPYGAEQLKRGAGVWSTIRDTKDQKYLAREWMSWGLPGRCLPTAQKLATRSKLFGTALSYNARPAAAPEAPAADPVGDAVSEAQAAEPTVAPPEDAAPAEQPADTAQPEETPAPDLRGPQ
ncbi:hypothetical protein [Caulobacter sp. NIBR1757]|uniref:hypothetical protein n=1 Tax=Caulobacter sp. NIBR1757 TaxID=3016000 RepID=UPI0022F0622C|nr:hypothetical protein [Caulobacter sp. NIBR1757]WGM38712.1 hypothetical protein AMEJIAPC_01616 [Caulobacter sp. NIBR1757]